ncbi:hypothetical protein FVA74_09405 [Salinibacterium sp. dk2585]|uniref:hypothetical protein n=1 Tax=unclassified Salinibacterium TaxID=2632331 RepID=UPI0011C24FC7|nr:MULTISPECIES: hypothetical protein [unclassified Salinibacterium]QEE61764.1 hypothetical protein FVA74_09405 [Salinibacterium sp. dk2585]TXK54681.1 hypothetical protein FVP63_06555 [Salinibacterium sp. dk5596]
MNLEKPSPVQAPAGIARRRRLAAVGVALAGLLALSGCATTEPTPTPGASGSPSPSASPSTSPSASAEPGEAPAPPADEATPVGVTCQQLITPDDLYAYNPNLAHIDGEAPAAGTPGARAVAAKGVACVYRNLTSNETIVVSASTPGPTALTQARAELSASATPADGLGGEGWFGGGTATVIAGEHLVTVSSDIFTAPADAAQLTTTAVSHLP